MANRPALSVSEREVLKVLWDHGPRTVREINEVLESQGPVLGLYDGGDFVTAFACQEVCRQRFDRGASRVSGAGQS